MPQPSASIAAAPVPRPADARPTVVSLLPAAGTPGTLATTAFHCALAEGTESVGGRAAVVGLALHDTGWKAEALAGTRALAPWLPPLPRRGGDRREAHERGVFRLGTAPLGARISWRLELLLERALESVATRGDRVLVADTRSPLLVRTALRCAARLGWRTIVVSNEAMTDAMSDPSTRDDYHACVVGCADGIWCVSEYLADYWKALGAEPGLIFVAPSVVRPSSLARPLVTAPAHTAAYVGNLAHREIDHLLDVAALVLARVPDFKLGIYGDANARVREELEHRIRELGLGSVVSVREPVAPATIPAELERWSALVLPRASGEFSTAGFPNKLGEYLASGRPVVTTAVGDIPRHLTAGVDAYLVPPDDPAAFSDALAAALSSPDEAAAVGAAGRRRAAELLGGDNVAQRLLDFSRGLPAGPRCPLSARESLAARFGPDPALVRRDLVRLYRAIDPSARPTVD